MEKEKFLTIITKNVVTTNEDATAADIAGLMKENNIGVVVIIKEGQVTGIVSERDITRRIVAEGLPPDLVKAREFMTTDLITAEIHDGLNNIYKTLCEIKFRHLLIMDNGKLAGITSIRDFLDTLTCAKKRE
ncbi:cyclic nucleotide-binding/CBS domain-containing protein [Candidatus Omnitrophota bacterium]